jgi:hypothetical protein
MGQTSLLPKPTNSLAVAGEKSERIGPESGWSGGESAPFEGLNFSCGR